ncbi:MAG: MATE family efflux transporter [Chitinophagaceae bacterium]|nr:MATE family efflux transporter [Chitinophagaceae bacterium]
MNKKVLRWNFIFQYGYVLTNIFNSILLLPLYLKNIDAATLGIWLATGNILSWMTLVDPGVGDVLQQKIAELRGKKLYSEVSKLIGSGFIASGIILLISILIGFIFYFLLGSIVNKDVSQYPNLQLAFLISVLATGFSLVSFSMSGINQGMHNAAPVAIASLLANLVFLMVNLVFLFLAFGVMSIALANLSRALFLVSFNLIAMLRQLKKDQIAVIYDLPYFKKFIRIFSFTSASRIISGLSGSMDLIILARYIPPSMITVFEVNKRPVSLTQSLIGRHSVALMPSISHAKGSGDFNYITSLINKQFTYYTYATLFICFTFWLTYEHLITLWTGPGQYAGDIILLLLITNFFFALIGYFMSNMGYAVGDIKRNSIVYIIRGLLLATLYIIIAPIYGIKGTLISSICAVILTDFSYFTYRLYKLGYLQPSLIRGIFSKWSVLVPSCFLMAFLLNMLVEKLFPQQMHFNKLVVNGGVFTIFYACMLFFVDGSIRQFLRTVKSKIRFRALADKS